MPTFDVTPDNAKQRLDKFLTERLPGRSRSQIQKLIKSGGVAVNGKTVAVHHFLRAKDSVSIDDAKVREAAGGGFMKKLLQRQLAPELAIVHDAGDFCVVNKPAGLLVHEAPGDTGTTLVDLILKKFPSVKKVGEDPMRPGIVHRLDKEVSGLLVIAKTQNMFDHLKNQFKQRKVAKEYTALVHGAPQRHGGEITFNIDRSETAGHKMAAVPITGSDNRGKRAVTQFETIEKIGNFTLLKIMPKTGRTHQIRVHLNAYGLPIVGDLTYRPKKVISKIEMKRIFLHANHLEFNDVNGIRRSFDAPLPDELATVLSRLKSQS
ncbi:MAG: RluA family pseudouridine synthase [Patescibacteria group bacterium]